MTQPTDRSPTRGGCEWWYRPDGSRFCAACIRPPALEVATRPARSTSTINRKEQRYEARI